MRYSTTFL